MAMRALWVFLSILMLSVLLAVAILAVRYGTSQAIPGWATYSLAAMGILSMVSLGNLCILFTLYSQSMVVSMRDLEVGMIGAVGVQAAAADLEAAIRDELSANNMPSILSEMGMEGRLSRGTVEDNTPRAGCRYFRHSGWAIHRRFEPVASQGESSTRHLTHAPVERRFRDDGSTVTSLYREKPPVAQSIQPRQHDQSHNLSSQCARVYEGVLGECCDFLCGGSFSVYRVSPVYTQTTIQEPVRTCDVMSRHREPEHIKG